MNYKDIGLAILVAVIWGINYIAMKFTAIEIPGFLATSLRFLLTAIILLPFASRPNISFRNLYFVSLISGIYIGLMYYSMHLGINTCLGIILMQLNVPFSILIARFMLDEKITQESLIGIFIAFIGLFVVIGSPDTIGHYIAGLIMLLAAFNCAMFSIQSKKLSKISPISLIFWTHLIASPHLFLVSFLIEGSPINYLTSISDKVWLFLLYSIVLSCILGIAIRIYLLRKYPVYKVVSFNLLVPFFGVISSMVFEQQIPTWHIFAGGGIIMFGITITQTKFLSFNKQVYENN